MIVFDLDRDVTKNYKTFVRSFKFASYKWRFSIEAGAFPCAEADGLHGIQT